MRRDPSYSSSGQQFAELIGRILFFSGYEYEQVSGNRDRGYDFVAYRGGEKWIVEAKYYRTAKPQFALIERAVARLSSVEEADANIKRLLVVSCDLPKPVIESYQLAYNIYIWGR